MTTAGPFSPASVTSEQLSFETVDWTDPGNASASDDSYAAADLGEGDESYTLRCTDFGLTNSDVPPGATIDGILVEVEANQTETSSARTSAARLIYGGSELSFLQDLGFVDNNFPFTPALVDLYGTLGGPTDTNGETITQAMVVDTSFGIDLRFTVPGGNSASTVSVDHVRLTVYYTAGGAFSLTADSGSFALTGQDVALKRGRRLVPASGSFALTGQALALKQGHKLGVGSGSFALTGQALGLLQAHKLSLGSGTFSLTGQALALSHGRPMTVGNGTFTLSGSTVGFLRGYLVGLGSGAFTLTGQSVAFLWPRTIALGSGGFLLTGQDVGLAWGHRLPVGSGSFALAGQALGFLNTHRLAIGSGTFTLTGQALAFARVKKLLMASGTFTFTGSDVTLRHNPPIALGSGSFILTGMRIGPFPRRPDQVRVFLPSEAPRWFRDVVRSIEQALRNRRLLEVGEAVDLPDAAEYRSRMVRVTGLDVVAVSNGTNWIRLDTGATL